MNSDCSKLSFNKNYNTLIAKYINSSMIADILHEKNIKSVITGYKLNIKNKRIFGKVSTLKIRHLNTDESPDGIYKALNCYDCIDDGDIIVVETEVPDRAYFGELNANLAIRHGAVATIVGGATRDIECVTSLDYPVFSKSYSPCDVKDYGTLDYINKTIMIDGVTIHPGDYIIADINGIVVISKEIVGEVIDIAISTVEKEMNVKLNVLRNLRGVEIPVITGNF